MTNHVFQCNKYQERIKDIKSGKIMIFYNDSICKVIVFLCKIKMKVTGFFRDSFNNWSYLYDVLAA